MSPRKLTSTGLVIIAASFLLGGAGLAYFFYHTFAALSEVRPDNIERVDQAARIGIFATVLLVNGLLIGSGLAGIGLIKSSRKDGIKS